MQAESGYWVHVCLYTPAATPSQRESTSIAASTSAAVNNPRSLHDIQRKVDRPLDARFSPLTVSRVNIPLGNPIEEATTVRMSPNTHSRRRDATQPKGAPSSPGPSSIPAAEPTKILRHTARSSPSSPSTATTSSSPANSTPVARFIKESSFAADDGLDGRQGAEVVFGIVHLFRDDVALHESTNAKRITALEDDSGCVLAVLGVPSHIGPADFLQYIEPASNAISQVRMIREERAQRCMVLLKFREATNAEEFHKMYTDKPFDSQEPNELCRVVYVTKVSFSTTSTLPYAYPLLANSDPWPIMTNNVASNSSSDAGAIAHRPAGSIAVELPTCPVCLERMDSTVTGLMTVTCQHTFHCSCLSRWSDLRCPVCRHTQSRMTKKGQFAVASFIPEHGSCAVCGTGSDLWVCLICATVACGRYKAGHAHRHHQETGHLYSLELETQRVWDYAGDGYVHRLIQNKAESKMIDEGGPTPASFREQPAAAVSRPIEASGSAVSQSSSVKNGMASELEEKMEAIGLEYSHLLSTQLESQRAFYEDQVRAYQHRMEIVEAECSHYQQQVQMTEKDRIELRQSHEAVKSRFENAHKNLEKSLSRIRSLDEELQGERLMSKGLVGKISKLESEGDVMKREVHILKVENEELKEQVRDLMIFLETRDTIEKGGGEEMRGGNVQVGKGKKPILTTSLEGASSTEAKTKPSKSKKKKASKPKIASTAEEEEAGEAEEDGHGDEQAIVTP